VLPGGACTLTSQCFQDYYGCQATTCTTNCIRSNPPLGKNCADRNNFTNWDYCDTTGVCNGNQYNSIFLTLYTFPLAVDISFDYNYTIQLQQTIFQILQSNFSLPFSASPSVRTCFERFQALQVVTVGSQRQIVSCIPTYIVSSSNGGTIFQMYVEIIGGPPVTAAGTTIIAMTDYLIAAIYSGALIGFGIQPFALVVTNPWDPPAYIPWSNGYLLGIAIGVACGCFILSILGCVLYYAIKSKREVYGSVATDSTASVQSGSSMRSESHASATD